MIELREILQVLGSFAGAWLAMRIELRWLRSDVNRAHARLDDHELRVRRIEIGD